MNLHADIGLGGSDRPEAVVVNGEALLCDIAGCLYWPGENCLIVSDLHLEKGSAYAARGQLLPPYDTRTTLARLKARVDYWQPSRIVSLGDSFHDNGGSARLDPVDRAALSEMIRGRDWIWITGNHDPDKPAGMEGDWASELAIGAVALRHEPSAIVHSGEIAGHLHPQARIVRRGKAVRRRCFAGDGMRLIMPAFGAYTGGINLRDRAFSGLFREATLLAHVMGRDRIYQISGKLLV